jgi:hypothetical protein
MTGAFTVLKSSDGGLTDMFQKPPVKISWQNLKWVSEAGSGGEES